MIEPSIAKGYISALDGLRGIAIILVVWFHIKIPPFQKGGFIGVDIFLVLSGFLITSILLREFGARGTISFKRFYIRRVLRLAPALLLTLAFFSTYSVLFLDTVTASINVRSTVFALINVANIMQALNIDVMSAIGHTWSLSLEEQFYIVYPISIVLVLRFAKTKRLVLLTLLVLTLISWLWGIYLIAHGADWHRVHFAPDTRFYQLLIGCSLAVFVAPLGSQSIPSQIYRFHIPEPIAWGSTATLLGLAVITRAEDASTYTVVAMTVALLTAVIVLYLLSPKPSLYRRCLEMKWLRLLGRISYGWYLYHQLIFALFLHSENRRLFIGVPLSLALALLSYRFVEQPVLRLKARYQAEGHESLSSSTVNP